MKQDFFFFQKLNDKTTRKNSRTEPKVLIKFNKNIVAENTDRVRRNLRFSEILFG